MELLNNNNCIQAVSPTYDRLGRQFSAIITITHHPEGFSFWIDYSDPRRGPSKEFVCASLNAVQSSLSFMDYDWQSLEWQCK